MKNEWETEVFAAEKYVKQETRRINDSQRELKDRRYGKQGIKKKC